MHYVNL